MNTKKLKIVSIELVKVFAFVVSLSLLAGVCLGIIWGVADFMARAFGLE